MRNRFPAVVSLVLVPLMSFDSSSSGRADVPEEFSRSASPTQQAQGSGYDRPARSPNGSRSEVIAPHGMVATSQALAAQVGLEILRAGGNAIDAAVAVNATLGLVEPHMNGIGGDLFAILWHAESQQLYALNATGRSPHGLRLETLVEKGLDQVPEYGPMSWMVPGAVDGWDQLLTRFGTMSLEQVLAPAIRYAQQGFPVPEIIAHDWSRAEERLAQWSDSARTYLPGGRAPRAGEVFKNPDLARTYEQIAQGGRDAFYKGPIAQQIVAFSKANGGYLSERDFREHTSTWVDPVSTNYRGYEVWELPPNSHGVAALVMLNLLEGFDLGSMGHSSAAALHVMVEAKKLAFADRDQYVADPEFNPLPTTALLSKPYAALRRQLIDSQRASLTVLAGDPYASREGAVSDASRQQATIVPRTSGADRLENGDTVYLTVVDRDRNAISLIESIFYGFGSQVVPGNLGFAMQNRATGFSLELGHLNVLEPHKRSLHTNMPGFVTKDGKPYLAFGVMGGNMQPQGHAQVLANLLDFGMNVQEAGDAARFRHVASSPGGYRDGGTILVESGVSDDVIAALEAKGHKVQRSDGGAMGGYQAIMIDPVTGMLRGGTDPRKDGAVVGY